MENGREFGLDSFPGGVSNSFSSFGRLQMCNLDFLVEAVDAGEAFGGGISTGVGQLTNPESGKAEHFVCLFFLMKVETDVGG